MKRQMNMKNGVKFFMYDALDCSWNFSNGFIIKYKHVLKSSHKRSAAVCEFTRFLSCWVACGFCHSFSKWIKRTQNIHTPTWQKQKSLFQHAMLSRQTSNVFMQTNAYLHSHDDYWVSHISQRLLQINYVCTVQKSFKVLFTHEMIRALELQRHCTLFLHLSLSLLLPLYLFIELQAIFQHGAHWHRDITFYSLNCVHTHRFRSRRATSAVLWRGIGEKSEFFTAFFFAKKECTWIV